MASPQICWTKQSSWSGPRRIFKVEDLRTAHNEVGMHLGIENHPISPQNRSAKSSSAYGLSRAEKKLIEDYYSEDFYEFDYPTG